MVSGTAIAILNQGKLDFDKKLTLSALSDLAEVLSYDDTLPEQVEERAAGVAVLITKEMPVPAAVIESLPSSVRLICEAGTGYNNIDIYSAKQKGITVCNVPTYSTEAVAHMVITYVLNLSCSMLQQQRKLASGDVLGWRSLGSLPHFEVTSKTLGLIGGRGAIGSAVATVALALGMKVLISSRGSAPPDLTGTEIVDLDTLLAQSDFVSIHCPLNDSTRHSIGGPQFLQMKSTAYIINTARGAIINQAELVQALQDGVIAGAALDVQEVEPLPSDSPLLQLPNVILTPHIGWQRIESRQRLMDLTAANIRAFQENQPINVVN
mmetsp:Transcript_19728/g.54796  ORF Transcript_19728/g.54796 Transcript_19728/m.54796 type:complete len:323 (+) Transcript_19728:290-1258(+)